MNKKDMLIKFNHAFMAYKDFLYGNYNQELYENNNLDLLLCLFSSLTFLLNIESIKTKDESPNEYLSHDLIIKILETITTRKNDGYYIDNTFISKNPEEVLKIVRNKIAHGDFFVDHNAQNILINYQNQDLKIKTNAFIAFTILIIERINLYTNSQKYSRNNLYANIQNLKPLKKTRDIESLLQNIYFIEYQFQNVTPYDKELIEIALKNIPSYISSFETANNRHIENIDIKKFFGDYHLIVEPSITPLSLSNNYLILKQFILENFRELSKLDLVSQVTLITEWFYKLERNNKPQDNLVEGIHFNLRLLNELQKKPTTNIEETLIASSSSGLQSSLIEMIITNDLLGFYVHYQYPLENLCKEKEDDYNIYFDCAKLDLSSFKPTIFIPPTGQITSCEQGANGCQKRIDNLKLKINSFTIQEQHLNEKLPEIKEDSQRKNIELALANIKEQLKQLKEKLNIEIASLAIYEKNIEEFTITTNQGYRYNRYLIEYIRNAIAHGNVYFDYSKSHGNSQKCQIRFLNIHDNQTLLDLTTSLIDFEKLFNNRNMQVFNQYLSQLEKGKSK